MDKTFPKFLTKAPIEFLIETLTIEFLIETSTIEFMMEIRIC